MEEDQDQKQYYEDLQDMDDIVSEVCEWSVVNINNTDMLKPYLTELPMQFNNPYEYFLAFGALTLEEVRAQLKGGLESLGKTSSFPVQIHQPRRMPSVSSNTSKISITFTMTKEYLVRPVRPRDVLLLSRELKCNVFSAGETCPVIAVVGKAAKLKPKERVLNSEHPCEVCVLGLHQELFTFKQEAFDDDREWRAAFLSSIPVARNLRAFVTKLGRKGIFPHFMDVILNKGGRPAARSRRLPMKRVVLEDVLEEESDLNESQRRCIVEVLENDGLHLVHGPPGTGKTRTLVTILTYLFNAKVRTVLAAPTNIAVGEVAKRVILRMQSGLRANVNTALGDIILVGDDEKIVLDGPLDSIFVESRLDRLEKAIKHWPKPLRNFANFLLEFPNDFERAKRNEQAEGESGDTVEPIVDPWKFFYDTSFLHADSIKECASTFLKDLPYSAIIESTRKELADHVDLIIEFQEIVELHRPEYQMSENFPLLYKQRAISPRLREVIRKLRSSANKVADSSEILASFGSKKSGSGIDRKFLTEEILCHARIVFATVGCTGRRDMETVLMSTHTVVVDEATQLPEAVTSLLLHPTVERLILVGDHRQLPATVISNAARRCFYDRSLFERLDPAHYHSSFLLDTQYRMHPEISKFPKNMFYHGRLDDWHGLEAKGLKPWHLVPTNGGKKMFPEYGFFDLPSVENRDPFDTSTYNETEASFITEYLVEFAKAVPGVEVKVGVITPYTAQVNAIKKSLRLVKGAKGDDVIWISAGVEVEVKSVDGSQGQEKDVIIISLVRANDVGGIGFVSDKRRLNVALTRAKFSCIVVGDSRTLQFSLIFKNLIADSRNRGVYYDIRLFPELGRLINAPELIRARAKPLLQMNSTPSRDLQNALMFNTPWNVFMLSGAWDTIRNKISHDVQTKLFGFLNRLAEGYRPPKREFYPVLGFDNLIESRIIASTLTVIWAVALDAEQNGYNQIIQVYDIVPKSQAETAIRRVQKALSRHSDDYLTAISYTKTGDTSDHGESLVKPILFPKIPKIIWHRNLKASVGDENGDEPQAEVVDDFLTLAKKYRLTADVIRRVFENSASDIELPLTLSEEEKWIVDQRDSLFVLGRSGTGKTTVMTMRMYQHEQSYYLQKESYEQKPIQIMFTASPSLCASINAYYSNLRKSILVSDEDDQDVQENDNPPLHPDGLDDLGNPAFVSFADFLSIMDSQLEYPLLPHNNQASGLADVAENSEDDEERAAPISRARPSATNTSGKEVTFDRFRDIYWKKLSFGPKVDELAIWTEFQSSIKGSFSSLKSPKGILPEDDYLTFGSRYSSGFGDSERVHIYSQFGKYEKLKRSKNDWDAGDLTSHIYLQLSKTGYHGRIIDHVYVDEVQDLTLAQIALFKFICRNRHGFIFAGDTAQTISAGVGFRFASVRGLFYEEILPYIDPTLTNMAKLVPEVQTLTQNYRTHSGILNLAGFIVEMLYRYFPSTIDKLPKETSLVEGPEPVVFEDNTIKELLARLFGNKGTVSLELGANQVIIVRNAIAKAEVSKIIETALVLTVFEAKGLEFEDVLCYNFFADSPFKYWRVLCKLDSDMSSTDSQHGTLDALHQILCSELKALYVVITRCKKRLWFFDEGIDKRKPAFDMWTSRNLVQNVSTTPKSGGKTIIEPLANQSSSEEWQNMGIDLFLRHMYLDARRCFVRAGDGKNILHCDAVIAEREGEALADSGKVAESQQKYHDAGVAYEALEKHREAASAYELAKKFDKAHRMFLLLREYNTALACCHKGKLYAAALRILQLPDVKPETKDRWGRKIALLHHAAKSKNGMLESLSQLTSEHDRRSFLERYKYYDELLKVDTETAHYDKVADVQEQKDDLFEAAHSWKKHGSSADMVRVLLRIMRPLYCFTLADIPFDSARILQKIDLVHEGASDNSTASFELILLRSLLCAASVDPRDWTTVLDEARKRVHNDGNWLDLVESFLVLESYRHDDQWQGDPQTLIKALKTCHREFSELAKTLTDTSISYQRSEYYRIFGLEYTLNPERCFVNNSVLQTIRSTLEGGDVLASLTDFSRIEMNLSDFAIEAQRFVVLRAEKTMRRGLKDLEAKAELFKPCSTLLLGGYKKCDLVNCRRVHNREQFLRNESERIFFQIDMVEFAAGCKDLSEEFFISRRDSYRGDLLEMLNPTMATLFIPINILDFKQSTRVNIIFEEYKRTMAEYKLDIDKLIKTLLVSQSTASLIWYPELAEKNASNNQVNEWALWNAFHWLRVEDINEDPIIMSGRMGAKALIGIAGGNVFRQKAYPTLPPRFYTPILERFLSILIIRDTCFWMTFLPVRLLADLVCGHKSAEFDYVLAVRRRRGRQQVTDLKDMLCCFFKENAQILKNWFNEHKLTQAECRGHIMRILWLMFGIYFNYKDFRREISQTLGRVNWPEISPLGNLREQLQLFRNTYNPDRVILGIMKEWDDEFVLVTNQVTPNIPSFLRQLRKVDLSEKEPIKDTLRRHFSDSYVPHGATGQASSLFKIFADIVTQGQKADVDETVEESKIIGAAPVEEEIEVKLPPRILRRIRKVLATVRERIERRNSIENLRDRYVFVATEYFKGRDVSTEFLSFYVDTVCGVRMELVNNLEKVAIFLESSLEKESEGIAEIVDEMWTYKEGLEKHLAIMDVNNPKYTGKSLAGYRFAWRLVAEVRKLMENGQRDFGELLKSVNLAATLNSVKVRT